MQTIVEHTIPKKVMLNFVPISSTFNLKRTITIKDRQSIDFGRLIEGSESPTNLKFSSKVVSRSHAKILFSDAKVYIQDTQSSSGTFLNSSRLSPQGQASDFVELKDQDIIQLGENYNLNGGNDIVVNL
jgi:pSer/pThr/pTyr-binding forkhead associated (FHA) protein